MSRMSRHAGISLLESLVAIAILAVAVLGMLGVQLRTLADTQTSVRRAQAVRLIEDFAERIKTHPEGFRLPEVHAATGWDAMPAPPDCRNAACGPAALAHWDLAAWKQAIADTLPLGLGQVFELNDDDAGHRRQLGVMVAWRANERAQGKATDADHAAYRKPFVVDGSPRGAACPLGLICHLAHAQP